MMENQSFAGKQVKSFDGKTSNRWKTSRLTENQSSTWKQMEALTTSVENLEEAVKYKDAFGFY